MATKDGRARTSRQRYLRFVQDYQQGLLDDQVDAAKGPKPPGESASIVEGSPAAKPTVWLGGQRRAHLREYLRWLWPHRYGCRRFAEPTSSF